MDRASLVDELKNHLLRTLFILKLYKELSADVEEMTNHINYSILIVNKLIKAVEDELKYK